MPSLTGQIILNQYRVEDHIASGGMGAVYRVLDLKSNYILAMKVLHADLADDPSVFKRFQREASALERLRHSNIVPFYGIISIKRGSHKMTTLNMPRKSKERLFFPYLVGFKNSSPEILRRYVLRVVSG